VVRPFAGPHAVELALLCRPVRPLADAAAQAETAYRSLAEALVAQHATPRDLVAETLFLRDVRRDLPAVLAARERVLRELGGVAHAPQPAAIGQAPLDERATFELLAAATVPHDPAARTVRDVRAATACGCPGCARAGARLVTLGDQLALHSGTLYGAGDDAHAQAADAFRVAEQLLAACGMGVRDVVRTWIQLRDIDRDYDALNAARRAFFARHGIELRPASTGVGGDPFPERHVVALSVHALKSPRPLDVTGMATPLLNEAWSYGADFSRGLRVAEANRVTLHVSGTASIDEAGRTIHLGDFAAQAERMLDNIASLLAQQGADVGSLVSGVTYVRHARDAGALRALYRRRGFDGFPCALVQAPLCRPDLLCETEVVAMLPPAAAGA
jgi:enamine deaminase RidA (YjgF/YER057c/UK114 family)